MLYKIYGALPRPLRRLISRVLNAKFLIGIIAIVERDGEVLLLHSLYKKAWSLPEGFLKKGEDPKKAMLREIHEELGVDAEISSIADAVHTPDRPMLDLIFFCRLPNAPLKPDRKEVAEARFFKVSELPTDLVSTHRAYIERYAAGKG